jgi:hypothetical protein
MTAAPWRQKAALAAMAALSPCPRPARRRDGSENGRHIRPTGVTRPSRVQPGGADGTICGWESSGLRGADPSDLVCYTLKKH